MQKMGSVFFVFIIARKHNLDVEDIFKDILDPVTIEELLRLGHLAPLRSKGTTKKLDSTGLKKSRGDFVSSEM